MIPSSDVRPVPLSTDSELDVNRECASHELPGGGPLLRFEALCTTDEPGGGRDVPAELICTSACCASARAARTACLGASGEVATRFERAFIRAAFGALRANCTRDYCDVFAAFLDEGPHSGAPPCVGLCGQPLISTGAAIVIAIVLTICLWTAVLMAWRACRRLFHSVSATEGYKQYPSVEMPPSDTGRDVLPPSASEALAMQQAREESGAGGGAPPRHGGGGAQEHVVVAVVVAPHNATGGLAADDGADEAADAEAGNKERTCAGN